MLMMPLVILTMTDDSDREYMEWLYTQYHRLMLSTAWKFVKTQADVEDIVSDSCVALIKNMNTIRGKDCNVLKSYIVSTVRNTAIDYFRRQQRTNARFLQGDDEVIERVADDASLEHKVLLREELRIVRQAISNLSEHERDVLRLKYQKGKSDIEIAEMIGLSESSVRVYVMRARKHIMAVVYGGEQK
ncbi:MAG: sigma-70 family RNA polymerase sigma factor [Raoultibacter sp.]